MVPILFLFVVAASASLSLGENTLITFQNNLKQLHLNNFFNGSNEKLDISNNYLELICIQDVTERNVSELCAKQIQVICQNTELLVLMADAWSKIPFAGMITASRGDWGAYDQCIGIEHVPDEGPKVLGKQCTMGLAIPVDLSFQDFYLLSYCVPDACTALDLVKLIQIDLIPQDILTNLVNDNICSTKETNGTLDASSIAVTSLFSFIFALVILSTVYEIYLHKRQIKNKIPIMTAFSVFGNGKKIFQVTHGKGTTDQILVFHGIKVISMMWILAGHAASILTVISVTNREEKDGFVHRRYSQYLATAFLAVDTFFFISGFLVAYQYFKSAAHKPLIAQVISIPQMIIHRYLRITPVVLFFFLYTVYLAEHVGRGPMFSALYSSMNGPCKRYWWAVFLYVQNYNNPTELCWVHLWYLSADWQLYLLSPLLLIPMAWQFRRRFKMVMIALVVLNVFFLLIPLCTKLVFPDFDPDESEYDTHSKLVTYFMGIMFGFYLRCRREKPYIFRKEILNIFMWLLSLAVLFTTVVLLHEANAFQDSHVTKSLIHVFIKPFWCLGLMFVIYSCTYGFGGFVNWILSSALMQVISKLTFCMYILHAPVIAFWIGTRRTRMHFNDFNMFFNWCGHFIISLIVSLIWTLAFESPLITIERVLLGGGARPRHPNTKNDKAEKNDTPRQPKENITVVHKPPIDNGSV